ncbi:hypothetical protein VNO80_15190 [Phaseolus coccineus]|uniref:Cupin type-1 domain-containing protein n=1 Tax=Phaseolus coccineus TaxID=3886 RepID=A0AAN9R248_PHACN
MPRPFTLSLLSLSLLLFATACFATTTTNLLNSCRIDNLNALKPDHRVESEGGFIETWSSKHPELQCAGVTFSRRTIYHNGLHVPSYSPYSQMIIAVQGEGALGLAMPGCPQTYEEAVDESSPSQKPSDRHQKIRQFSEGDVLLIPPGVPSWTFNTGDNSLVTISLLHTSNEFNQLDQIPREFYLAGNPDIEHPEAIKEQKQVEEEGGNVLGGFGKGFLARSLGIDEDIAKKLISPDDEMKQIVKLKSGLSVISPKWQGQQDEDEDESQRPSHRKRVHQKEEKEVEPLPHGKHVHKEEEKEVEPLPHGKHVHKEEEKEVEPLPHRKHVHKEEEKEVEPLPHQKYVHKEEEKEVEPLPHQKHVHKEEQKEVEPLPHRKHLHKKEEEEDKPRARRTRGPTPSPGGEGHRVVEEEEEFDEPVRHKTRHEKSWKEHRPAEEEVEKGEAHEEWETKPSKYEGHGSNGIEETLCTLKLQHNVARASSADFYNPKAGRVYNLNSLSLPALQQIGLSAQYVVLYKNGIYSPHWNLNANSVIYVIRGQGHVRVVNSVGIAVFDDELKKGQLLVVPQNFMVAEEAGEQGFEYVVFKTNHNAMTSYLKETFRALPAEVIANIYKLPQSEVRELKFDGNWGPLVNSDQDLQQSS